MQSFSIAKNFLMRIILNPNWGATKIRYNSINYLHFFHFWHKNWFLFFFRFYCRVPLVQLAVVYCTVMYIRNWFYAILFTIIQTTEKFQVIKPYKKWTYLYIYKKSNSTFCEYFFIINGIIDYFSFDSKFKKSFFYKRDCKGKMIATIWKLYLKKLI